MHAYRVSGDDYGKASLVDVSEADTGWDDPATAGADAITRLTDKAAGLGIRVTAGSDGAASVAVSMNQHAAPTAGRSAEPVFLAATGADSGLSRALALTGGLTLIGGAVLTLRRRRPRRRSSRSVR
ncbi:hypothetical protein JK359_38160 [Streptomyces actinomycinicus]|uniref:LPXTG cell wall anchor domain-containing protein n=1 Tax=Streptomyces actinomycinicus TaxID=1695166 RepID=A0A937ETL6_9ACTN|nr:hypothetical protein [Streptomyces actinomycinicus]MBL1087689.1 hypothetical protein [Streptomyces actinomycinicus]